jgi:hypothetical protein
MLKAPLPPPKLRSRRPRLRSLGGAAVLLLGSLTAVSAVQLPAFADTPPTLKFANTTTQSTFGTAYDTALTNLLTTNTVKYDSSKNTSGLMSGGTFIQAGGGYAGDAWTRDSAINAWNGASLLDTQPAANSLWSAVGKQSDGTLIINQDEQVWDQVVWITGAWNHYLVTGDKTFLTHAYQAATNTLNLRKKNNYNSTYGLYMGPSFFNDGIAGYPAPPADSTESKGAAVGGYAASKTMMALSTNDLYYAAYRNAAAMATALGKPTDEVSPLNSAADDLKKSINKRLWNANTGLYDYFIHGPDDGSLADQADHTEEGTGLSFAILFGIADSTQAQSVMSKTHIQPYGIVDTYPNYSRYSDAKPGRHNEIVWPMVQGLWADAAASSGNVARFASEVRSLAGLANTKQSFYEIYNAHTGAVDGGWQADNSGGVPFIHWESQPDQTWSATAYLHMIDTDLFGMKFDTSGITFAPTLPKGWGDATLSGVRYRGATLTIALHGAGNTISKFTIDDKSASTYAIAATLTGSHTIDITLTDRPGPVIGNDSLCLDDRYADTTKFNPIQTWRCNGTAAQQVTMPGDGTLRILGNCVDVYYGRTANGTPVELYPCNNTGAQQWVAQPDGTLKNPQSGRCLYDPALSTPGTQLQIHDCNSGFNEKWALP